MVQIKHPRSVQVAVGNLGNDLWPPWNRSLEGSPWVRPARPKSQRLLSGFDFPDPSTRSTPKWAVQLSTANLDAANPRLKGDDRRNLAATIWLVIRVATAPAVRSIRACAAPVAEMRRMRDGRETRGFHWYPARAVR